MRSLLIRSIFCVVLLCSALPAQQPPAKYFLIRIELAREGATLQTLTDDEKRIGGEHFGYLQKLHAEGTIVVAGQALDPKALYGIMVVKAGSQAEAESIMNGDPGVKQNLFRGTAVPFNLVLERAKN
jgi:uncharacterized protein YciI